MKEQKNGQKIKKRYFPRRGDSDRQKLRQRVTTSLKRIARNAEKNLHLKKKIGKVIQKKIQTRHFGRFVEAEGKKSRPKTTSDLETNTLAFTTHLLIRPGGKNEGEINEQKPKKPLWEKRGPMLLARSRSNAGH